MNTLINLGKNIHWVEKKSNYGKQHTLEYTHIVPKMSYNILYYYYYFRENNMLQDLCQWPGRNNSSTAKRIGTRS